MRWITAAACVGLVCIAFACDKSNSNSKSNSQNDLPPDLKEQTTPAAPATKPMSMAAPAPTSAPATQASAGKPINQFCAVETKNKIDPKVTTLYEGKVIGFCCPDCIPDFKKDPAKYMASIK
jgi:YHS domain-containing protein